MFFLLLHFQEHLGSVQKKNLANLGLYDHETETRTVINLNS
jgi:hypothetical protein